VSHSSTTWFWRSRRPTTSHRAWTPWSDGFAVDAGAARAGWWTKDEDGALELVAVDGIARGAPQSVRIRLPVLLLAPAPPLHPAGVSSVQAEPPASRCVRKKSESGHLSTVAPDGFAEVPVGVSERRSW
jgi:hypothetical protein